VEPVTVAVKVCDWPVCTVAVVGETLTDTAVAGVKVAAIEVLPLTVMVQLLFPVQPLLQLEKTEPWAAAGIRVTVVPPAKEAAQTLPQLMPPGLLEIEPLPVLVICSWYCGTLVSLLALAPPQPLRTTATGAIVTRTRKNRKPLPIPSIHPLGYTSGKTRIRRTWQHFGWFERRNNPDEQGTRHLGMPRPGLNLQGIQQIKVDVPVVVDFFQQAEIVPASIHFP
jgi:hypothetical protein